MKRVALAVAVLLGGAAGAQQYANGDRQKLHGEWEVVSMKFGDMDAPEEFTKGMKVAFQGARLITTWGAHRQDEQPFRLDETKKPRQLELGKGPNISVE